MDTKPWIFSYHEKVCFINLFFPFPFLFVIIGKCRMAKKTDKDGGALYYVCCTMIIVNGMVFGMNIINSKSGGKGELSWSIRAAEEAEAVADIPCSGHGRAFLDGLVCECNSCYEGFDCSIFSPHCVADAQRYRN